MMKTLIAAFILSFSAPLLACTGASCKTEVELKVNLTKNGYNALRATLLTKFEAEKSERTDIYFDIFKNSAYYLKKAQPPIKLRFQYNGEVLKWQTQKTIEQDLYSIFSMKKTQAIAMEISENSDLFNMLENYHEELSALNPEALVIAASIQKSLETSNIINFTRTLCDFCATTDRYYSTHINHKKRVKTKLKLSGDTFEIMVGETNNNGIVTYELEAEVKKSTNLKLSAERLNEWLKTQGMTSESIDESIPSDPALPSEIALKKLHSL